MPAGNSAKTGQRISPPALDDISWVTNALITKGIASLIIMRMKGNKNAQMPTTSIQICVRLEKRPEITSILTCSWRIRV